MSVMKKNGMRKDQNFFGILIFFLIFALDEIFFILRLFGLNLGYSKGSGWDLYLRLLIFAVFGIAYLIKVHRVGPLLFSAVYMAILAFTMLCTPEVAEYIPELLSMFAAVIFPLILLLYYVDRPDITLNYMRIISYIIMFKACLSLVIPRTVYFARINGMVLGYDTIIWWAVVTYFAFKYHKWYDFAFSFVVVGVYVVFANRGVLLCVAVFYLYCVWTMTDLRKKPVTFTTLLLVGMLFLMIGVLFYRQILDALASALKARNITSRTLNMLLTNSITDSNGRAEISAQNWAAIMEHPLRGYGIGYDRVIGGGSGLYAHNLFMELWVDFGLILGSGIALAITCIHVKMLFFCRIPAYRDLFAVVGIPGYLILLFSNSVYNSFYVFWVITVYVLYRREMRRGCPLLRG